MRALVCLVAASLCAPVRADLFTAQLAYGRGDYERAFKDYRELAELGQPLAQYNLAIMYSKGQGVQQSDLNAYAWATLAAAGGEARGKSVADRLRPELAPGSEQMAQDIIAPFSRAALDARLMPRIEKDAAAEARCRVSKLPDMEVYPLPARRQAIQGFVFVQFVVMPDGTTRNPRVLYAIPSGVFEGIVRDAVLRTRFPAEASAKIAHCHIGYRFAMGASDYPNREGFFSETRKKAEAGDTESEFVYGMLLAGFPRLPGSPQSADTRADPLPWFLKAAQGGERHAQYQIGTSLLLGLGCHCEENKGEIWLRKAAEADESDAQVTLAAYALRGTPDAADTQRAKLWLERAAASHHHDGMLYLSALLAATPFAALRDPPRALSLLDEVRKDLGGDPVEFEIRAAAEAASGAFSKAADTERHATRIAKRLGWDLAPLKERLARYQAGQPWYGNLLVL